MLVDETLGSETQDSLLLTIIYSELSYSHLKPVSENVPKRHCRVGQRMELKNLNLF